MRSGGKWSLRAQDAARGVPRGGAESGVGVVQGRVGLLALAALGIDG